jgi:hypothetical protein
MTMDSKETGTEISGQAASRRQLLKLGAVAAPAAMMLQAGHAWAASANCQVQIPLLGRVTAIAGSPLPAAQWRAISGIPATLPGTTTLIAPDPQAGSTVTVDATQSGQILRGSDIQAGTLNGAYLDYLARVQQGAGLSCLVSLGIRV